MQNISIGECIRQRRKELNLAQEQVCDGICDPVSLSRLENGKQTPSRNRINALLQRLGLPDDRYFALLSKNELELVSCPWFISMLPVFWIYANVIRKPQNAQQKEKKLSYVRALSTPATLPRNRS